MQAVEADTAAQDRIQTRKHADSLQMPCLVQGDGHAGRVDQVQRIVEVPRLAVDLASGAGAARHVHQLRAADVQHPLLLGCSGISRAQFTA
jgi:hypothetical protein